MGRRIDADLAASKATEIVVAFLNSRTVEPRDLPRLVREVRGALEGDEPAAEPEEVQAPPPQVNTVPSAQVSTPPESADAKTSIQPTPAVPIADSITQEFIISLEDGKQYRSLRRHLMAKYGMTPDDYRKKWGLPSDYPMVAPSYAEERSLVAKRSGLGKAKAKTSRVGKRSR